MGELNTNIDLEDDDNVIYRLTPWACLYEVLSDYKIDASNISGKVGKHIVDDFMELMERQGYLEYVNNEDKV